MLKHFEITRLTRFPVIDDVQRRGLGAPWLMSIFRNHYITHIR